jgi:hypothetical protein
MDEDSVILSLILEGDLPSKQELLDRFEVEPRSYHRRGDLGRGSWRVPQDIWTLDLAEWDGKTADDGTTQQAVSTLERLAPALRALDRAHLTAELSVLVIQYHETSDYILPAAVLAAAAAGGLSCSIRVAVYPPGDDNDDETEGPSRH